MDPEQTLYDFIIWAILAVGALFTSGLAWFFKGLHSDVKKAREDLPNTLKDYATRNEQTLIKENLETKLTYNEAQIEELKDEAKKRDEKFDKSIERIHDKLDKVIEKLNVA